jgi:hypothetical protein
MNGLASKLVRCAIYTRKSTEYNLELAFNSLDAQREACEAYIKSQAHEGWRLIPARYDDGAFSGASLERPALQQLLADICAGKIDIVPWVGRSSGPVSLSPSHLPVFHHPKIHSADQLGSVCLGGFHGGRSLLQSTRV